jgi:hypothetical protein
MAEDKDKGPHAPQGEEMPSVFIPKAALGDHQVQKGDSLDFLIVKDVDPETGEVEAGCDYSSGNMMHHDGEPAPSKMQDRLDKMEDWFMPATFTCDVNQLLADAACFEPGCMGKPQREAIEMYLRVKNLAAIGGTDYSVNLNALLTAAKSYQVLACSQREAIKTWITLQNAINDGAVVSSNANDLLAAAACYICLGEETRKNTLEFLTCSINTEKAPDWYRGLHAEFSRDGVKLSAMRGW